MSAAIWRRGPVFFGGLGLLAVVGLVVMIRVIESAPDLRGAGGGGTGEMPPAAVYVVEVEKLEAEAEARVTGTLRALAQAEVAAREPGAVVEVLIDEGQKVEAGAVLARLDGRRVKARAAELEAGLTAAKSLLGQREAERARAVEDFEMKEGLLERKAVSVSDVSDAKRALAVGEAQLSAARDAVTEVESQLDFLRVQVEDMEVVAPFAGVVVERHVEPGEWVSAGTVVASLTAVDPVEAWLRVPARHQASLRGRPERVRVRISSSGEVVVPDELVVVPEVEPLSQLFTVVATLGNVDGRMAPGESVTGIVPVGDLAQHWSFPLDALLRTEMGSFVYVVGEAEGGGLPAARRVAVRVAFEREGKAFVGLGDGDFSAGDEVVVEGNERLVPGQGLMVEKREK